MEANNPAAGKGVRPAVMSISFKEKAALYAAYMPHIVRGGLFLPTTRAATLGDKVYLILSLMDDPSKYPVAGKVVWINPAGVPGKQQGIGVQFPEDQTGDVVRTKIENLLGSAVKSSRMTHTL
jgi:type IV pilus assembly protein PilZ